MLTAPLAPVIDTQRSLAYDQLFLSWRLPPDSAPAWSFSVEYRRRGVVPGGAARGGMRGGLATARWGWQRLEEVSGSSAVIDRLEMDSVYVLRVRGCNKAGYGEYSEEVYLHTPPAPGTQTPPVMDAKKEFSGPSCYFLFDLNPVSIDVTWQLLAVVHSSHTFATLATINRALFCFLFFPFLPFGALWIVSSALLSCIISISQPCHGRRVHVANLHASYTT